MPEVKIIMKVSVGADLAVRRQRPGAGAAARPNRGDDVSMTRTPGRSRPVEQVAVIGVGEQDLAVGVQDVAGECGTAAGVVDAAQDVAAQSGGGHRGQHVRRIAQQCADVHRPGVVGDAEQRGGLRGGVGEVLTPGPLSGRRI